MKQIEKTFEGIKVRPKNMTPTEVLAIESIIDLKDVDRADYMFSSIFERIEVEIAGVWVPLKEKGLNTYNPANLSENVGLLYVIATWFMIDVIKPLFRKSEESK